MIDICCHGLFLGIFKGNYSLIQNFCVNSASNKVLKTNKFPPCSVMMVFSLTRLSKTERIFEMGPVFPEIKVFNLTKKLFSFLILI